MSDYYEPEVQIEIVSGRIFWKKNYCQSYIFKSDGNIWMEIDKDIVVDTFQHVEDKSDCVILYDDNSCVFFKLTKKDGLWGRNLNELNQLFLEGRWIDEYELAEVEDNIAWRRLNSDNHFYKSKSDTWFEKEGGKTVNTYKQTGKTESSVTLYDEKRQLFVKLTDDAAFTGKNFDDIKQILCEGRWMKIRIMR